jgi:branched-chain amino acid transport system substrate-binding protein
VAGSRAVERPKTAPRRRLRGYEAMRLALDAIERSETGENEDIIAALHSTTARQSALGTHSIDENDDTTLTDYGPYRIRDGQLVVAQTIHAR